MTAPAEAITEPRKVLRLHVWGWDSTARLFAQWSTGRPRWERLVLVALLAATALLYCWGLDRNGWANAYYSAAVMSGASDWTAFFFGSSDPANAITVDKPPMSLWVMALSVRLFGLSSWSILLPQALMGILTVYLLYVLVRRHTGAAVALLAAAFMSVTPVSTVMFRYNNPDALLILIMVSMALAVTTAIERQRPWLIVLAGALAGAGFLTKQLQVGLVLPALAITYLAFAATSWRRKVLHLGGASVAAAGVGGSWLLAVQLTDPALRPFIGGSKTNSALELALGYNGLQRLTGEAAGRTLAAGSEVDALDPGYERFLQPQFSSQFGWIIPLALAGLALTGVWLIRRRGTAGFRMLLLMSGIWFATSITVLAFMSGTLHPYYSLTVVPPISILGAIGLAGLLVTKTRLARTANVLTLVGSSIVAYATALRSSVDFPGLPIVLLCSWAITIAMYLLPAAPSRLRQVSAGMLVALLLLGPTLWSVNTVLSPHVGAGVVAGPAVSGIRTDNPGKEQLGSGLTAGHVALMFGDTPPDALAEILRKLPAEATWVTATVGSESAANYQLELARPVLPVGGFDGTDPSPTLEQFQTLVSEGKLGSLVVQNLPPLTAEGKGESARIVEWVQQNYPLTSIENAELYILHNP